MEPSAESPPPQSRQPGRARTNVVLHWKLAGLVAMFVVAMFLASAWLMPLWLPLLVVAIPAALYPRTSKARNWLVWVVGAILCLATFVWLPMVLAATMRQAQCTDDTTGMLTVFPHTALAIVGAAGCLVGLSLPVWAYRYARGRSIVGFVATLTAGAGAFAAWWLLDGYRAAWCVLS
jgi:hypothetical protein